MTAVATSVRTVVRDALVGLVMAVAGLCLSGCVAGSSAVREPPAAEGPTTVSGVTVGQSELPFDAAVSAGAVRTDAVTLVGPSDAAASAGSTTYRLSIQAPGRGSTDEVELSASGTCEVALPSGRSSATSLLVPLTVAGTAEITVGVSVPIGMSTCELVLDAFLSGKTYTGNSLTVTVHR